MLDLLLDLPSQLSLDLLGHWIGLRGIGLLDLAYANKEKRAVFVDLLQSKEMVLTDDSAYSDDYNRFFLGWCILRKLKFSYIVFGYGTTVSVAAETIGRFITMNGATLKTLGVHADTMISVNGLSWWSAVGTECSVLEEFELEVFAELDDAVLTNILRRNCATLRKVDLMIDDFEAQLPTGCSFPHLVEFHARAEVRLNGLTEFIINCPNLRRFAVDTRLHTMAPLLQHIAQHCQHTHSINLLQINDRSVSDIIRFCPQGPALHLMFDPEATETSIVNCFFRLKNIQSVTFLANDHFNDGCLAAMKQFCASTLRKLSINSCHGATYAALHALVKECKNLSILYLNKGPYLSAKQLCALVAACPAVTRLSLIAPYTVDNNVLTTMAVRMKELTFLNIENDTTDHSYTTKGLGALLQGCSKLTTVCLGSAYCRVVTDKISAKFKAHYPAVSIEQELSAGYEIDDSDEIQ